MADEIIQYQTEDGVTVIRLQATDSSVWLSQADMAKLFQTTKQSISLHIRNILDEGNLDEAATVKENLTVQSDGNRQVSRQITKLDDFLKLGDHPLLAGTGRVQAKGTTKRVNAEYDARHARAINAPSAVERHFVEMVGKAKAIEATTSKAGRKGYGGRA